MNAELINDFVKGDWLLIVWFIWMIITTTISIYRHLYITQDKNEWLMWVIISMFGLVALPFALVLVGIPWLLAKLIRYITLKLE